MPASAAPTGAAGLPVLTSIEQAILVALAAGARRYDIADQLNIPRTIINNRLNHLYGKLGARTAVHAVVTADRLGLLPPQPATKPTP
jgi:DNA-binding NarL/FixJ family response regulator